MTEGTELEPYARLAAALVGGGLAAGRNPNAAARAAKGAPTKESLSQQSKRLYTTLRDAGIKYDADEYGRAVKDAAVELRKQGFRKSTAGEAMNVLGDLANDIGKSPDFDDINGWISALGGTARDLRRQGKEQQAKAIDIIRDRLMAFEDSAPLTSRVPIPASEFKKIRSTARNVARRNIQARALNDVLENAETYASGKAMGIEQGLRNLVRSKKGKQLFNKSERDALMSVANGQPLVRVLRKFGFSLGGNTGNAAFLPTAGAGGLTLAGEPILGGSLAVAGTTAKSLSPYLTSRAFDKASAAIRSGKLRDQSVMDGVRADQVKQLVRGLLTAEAGVNSSEAPIQ
jgi:hypothetical protein